MKINWKWKKYKNMFFLKLIGGNPVQSLYMKFMYRLSAMCCIIRLNIVAQASSLHELRRAKCWHVRSRVYVYTEALGTCSNNVHYFRTYNCDKYVKSSGGIKSCPGISRKEEHTAWPFHEHLTACFITSVYSA